MKLFEVFAIFTVMVAGLNAMIPNGVKEIVIDKVGVMYNPARFPYIVHLENRRINTTLNAYVIISCGGSIIRTNTILTAAHCVEGANPENVKATAGIIHTSLPHEGEQSITARRIVCHEQFQNFGKNDIALVFLVDKFQISTTVNTVKLATPSQYHDSMRVITAGWGLLLNQVNTEWLHSGDFVMLGRDWCQQLIGVYFHEGLLCIYDAKGLQKTAAGDSGGPLVGLVDNVLVGLTVGSIPDPVGTYNARVPSIFANVSYYTNWISKNIGYDILFFEK